VPFSAGAQLPGDAGQLVAASDESFEIACGNLADCFEGSPQELDEVPELDGVAKGCTFAVLRSVVLLSNRRMKTTWPASTLFSAGGLLVFRPLVHPDDDEVIAGPRGGC